MDANQIERLKALALAADREEWMTSDGDATVYGEDGDSVCVCHTNIGKMPEPVFAVDRAKFIAEANPAAVLELIAEVERLRAAPAAGTVEPDAAYPVLKSIIEDGYLSDTNTARGHAVIDANTKAGKDAA